MSGVAATVLGESLLSAGIGASASRSAARTIGAAEDRATAETARQFDITQQQLAPFQEVAVGRQTHDRVIDPGTLVTGTPEERDFQARVDAGELDPQGFRLDPQTGLRQVTGFTGGALQELAGFGRSRVRPGEFIPKSTIPRFEGGIGDIPEFTRRKLELDPGFQFRLAEQEKAINRAAAAGGKVLSGNRLEEIMRRSGELASQEFGAAFNRDLTEFEIARQREQEQFGRGLTGFGLEAGREEQQFRRGVESFGRARAEETDYLNRLAALSNIGQTATTDIGQFGARAAESAAANIRSAGQASAAARIGTAGAVQNVIGDIASLAARYRPGGVTTTSTPVTGFDL